MQRISLLIIFNLFLMVFYTSAVEIPNADFEKGKTENGQFVLENWQQPETGSVVSPGYHSGHAIMVKGNGEDNAAWMSQPIPVQPGEYYEFSFWGRTGQGTHGGSAVSGPSFANRDLRLTEEWKRYAFVFRVPDNQTQAIVRLGHWRVDGTLLFDQPQLASVQPVYKRIDSYKLGEGERFEGQLYHAVHRMGSSGSNACRFLKFTNAGFNTHRWLFSESTEVIYRHTFSSVQFEKAEMEFNLNYHTGGICRVLARSNGGDWVKMGELDEVSSKSIQLPESLFPAKFVEIKLAGQNDSDGRCTFQIDQYRFSANSNTPLPQGEGKTYFAKVEHQKPQLDVNLIDLGMPRPRQKTNLKLSLRNKSDQSQKLEIDVTNNREERKSDKQPFIVLEGKQPREVSIPYMIEDSGDQRLHIVVTTGKQEKLYHAVIPFSVSYLYDADYGSTLHVDNQSAIWWCDATRKIAQSRPIPKQKGNEVYFSAARGEYEPVQIVVNPKADINNLQIKISDFVNGGHRIAAKHFTLKQVEYVYVHSPSDVWGCVGYWPDPLPLVQNPLALQADKNYPFWLTVHVPNDAGAGEYKGSVTFSDGNWDQEVSVCLNVYDFNIPETFNLRTAFGFSSGNVKRYHHLDTRDELDQVVDLYFQNFREHRISPYNPTMLHPIEYELNDQDFEFNFHDFEQAGERYFDEFGFTSLRLPLLGMGGGTFHSRRKGEIAGHEQGTPEHERLFKQYASTVEAFLKKKGWLDEAYVYWFDEPRPRDYEFVKEGMDMIHRNAPGLTRMLTEQPEEELFGYVDLWCPVLNAYAPEVCHQRQQKGEEIWWYICTGPKEPYPGLFTDHPAVDLRIWLWMTHKYDVEGCLVWQSNYWTSRLAYPEPHIQNPWDDPMSYQTGYGRPVGYKGHWGNGDGRFIYPPKGWQDGEKRIAGPVDSIRWEMLREGIEDYEYFHLIKQIVKSDQLSAKQRAKGKQLLQIPDEIVASRTDYTKDADLLYDYREKLAEFIEKNN